MHIQKNSHKSGRDEGRLTFGELYKEISRGRDEKASRLQERRWRRLNQLGWQ